MTLARRIRHAVALAAAPMLVLSCNKDFPTAPTDVTTGITIYEDANVLGRSALVTTDVTDLRNYNGPCEHDYWSSALNTTTSVYDWNDCVSSMSYTTTSDVANLQLVPGSCDHDGLNDCISSIRLQKR